MKWNSVVPALALVSVLLAPAASHAVSYDIIDELCLEQPRILVDWEIPRIPVGCEVIDCCPGCPGPWPLDWLIQLDPGVEHVDLTFEQTSSEMLERVGIDGKAEWISEGVLRVYPGETLLTGLEGDREGTVPVVRSDFGLLTGGGELAGFDLALAGEAESSYPGTRLQVQQQVQGVEVSSFDTKIESGRCGEPVPDPIEDVVRLAGWADGDDSVLLVDGARNSPSGVFCANDDAYQIVDQAGVGNLLKPGSCSSDVTLFSRGNALYHDSITSWTSGSDLVEPWQFKRFPPTVQLWVDASLPHTRPHVDLSVANYVLDRNRAGIFLNRNVDTLPPNIALPGLPEACSPEGLEKYRSVAYELGTINVYYITQPVTTARCAADPNVIFVGTTADIADLTHAIGHAFSLGDRVGGSSRDVMGPAGGVLRDHFYLGESFRMTVDSDSQINRDFLRLGVTHDCHPYLGDDHCPPATFD